MIGLVFRTHSTVYAEKCQYYVGPFQKPGYGIQITKAIPCCVGANKKQPGNGAKGNPEGVRPAYYGLQQLFPPKVFIVLIGITP